MTTRTKVGRLARPERPAVSDAAMGDAKMVAVADITPAKINDAIYKRVSLEDPATRALAENIQRNGLLEPLVLTNDNVILSGHRRYAACQLLGYTVVPVRYEELSSTDPEFSALLTSHNQQRVKTIDELFREELIRTDPEKAYTHLIAARQAATCLKVTPLVTEGRGKRSVISAAKMPFLRAIKKVLEVDRAYWPLSDRRVHYGLLNDPPLIHAKKPGSAYRNNLTSYKSLCELITRARLAGRVPFEALDDITRDVTIPYVHANVQPFIQQELDGLFMGYRRDLMQSQPSHIEIVAEKNTVATVVRSVAQRYTIPMTVGRGYTSLPPRQKMALRFKSSGKSRLVVLFVCDFDPEGDDIPKSFINSMREDFGVNADGVRVALNAQQVKELQLVPQMTAKAKSSRRNRFVKQHGENVFELEAIASPTLAAIVEESIRRVIDVALFNAEVDAEKAEASIINASAKMARKSLREGITQNSD